MSDAVFLLIFVAGFESTTVDTEWLINLVKMRNYLHDTFLFPYKYLEAGWRRIAWELKFLVS